VGDSPSALAEITALMTAGSSWGGGLAVMILGQV